MQRTTTILLTLITLFASSVAHSATAASKEYASIQPYYTGFYLNTRRVNVGHWILMTKAQNQVGFKARYQVKHGSQFLDPVIDNDSYYVVRAPAMPKTATLTVIENGEEKYFYPDYVVSAKPFDLLSDDSTQYNRVTGYIMSAVSKYFFYEARLFPTESEFEDHFKSLMARYGMSSVAIFKHLITDTEVAVMGNHKDIIIVFRGSESPDNSATFTDYLIDVSTDICFFCNLGDNTSRTEVFAPVHSGFYLAHNSVYQDIRDELDRLGTNGKRVWVTGESLGGALATLTAFRLNRTGVDIHAVYTTGSPRTGFGSWEALYNAEIGNVTWRHNRQYDPIADLPKRNFVIPLLSFEHVGTNVAMTSTQMWLNAGWEWDYPIFERNFFADFTSIHTNYPNALYDQIDAGRRNYEHLDDMFPYLPPPNYPAPL